jgi:hypothetical protein
MLVDVKEIKFKELAAAVKVLNDSGLLVKTIATVGVTKEAIVKAFVEGVQSVPDDQDGNWTGPEEVADYYSKIVIPDPGIETGKKEKVPKEKKEKVPKQKGEKSKSSLEVMKELIANKASDAEITKVFTEKLTKKDPKLSADFIAKRIKIYKGLAAKG